MSKDYDSEKKTFQERMAREKAKGFKEIKLEDMKDEGKTPSKLLEGIELDMDKLKRTVDERTVKAISGTPGYGPSVSKFSEIADAISTAKAKEEEELKEYREFVVQTLKDIEKNTAILAEMSMLLQKNNEKQDKILATMTEIMKNMKGSN